MPTGRPERDSSIGRWLSGLDARFGTAVLALLVAIDQLAQVILVAPWWWLTGSGRAPDPDETISGICGRHATWGWRWAIVAASLIDTLFFALTLGRERDHCASVAFREGRARRD